MNKQRRKLIEKEIKKLLEIADNVTAIIDEEQDAFDNLPESQQDGERGETMLGYIEQLEEVMTYINSAVEELEYCLEE